MSTDSLVLAVPPMGIVLGFALHWLTVAKHSTAAERLPFCRGAYLAFSLQLLLYAWAAFGLFGQGEPAALLVALGMTFSFAGDYFNLQFPFAKARIREPVILGILSFSIAQLLYIAGFLSRISPRELTQKGFLVPLLVFFLAAPAIVFRLRVFSKERPKAMMRSGFLYGFTLGAMVAVAVSTAIGRGGWWCYVGVGSIFFLVSDAVMGATTLHGRHPPFEYQIPWGTYLVAQGLILFGTYAGMAM